jgi:Ca2+-binding EF-hand superfamily protein
MHRHDGSRRQSAAWIKLFAGSLVLAAGLARGQDPGAPAAVRATAFAAADSSSDGRLTIDEYVAAGGRPAAALRRDFLLADLDGDASLSEAEFSLVSPAVPAEARGDWPDPVLELAAQYAATLVAQWQDWDRDGDKQLSAGEFEASGIARRVPGLEGSGLSDWDREGDGRISPEDANWRLEVAFGVRRPQGEMLRRPSGDVFDWRTFRASEREGAVPKDVFLRRYPAGDQATGLARFSEIDSDQDARLSFDEWAGEPDLWNSNLTLFQRLDADLSGRIEPAELVNPPLASGQKPFAPRLLPAFDADQDGVLSLPEFRRTPLANLLAIWDAADDANADGELAMSEFRFSTGFELRGLCAEFFRTLDLDRSGTLASTEWPFRTRNAAVVFKHYDADADGRLSLEEFLAIGRRDPAILTRDFRVVDVNSDQRLSLDEFRLVPALVPRELRSAAPNPLSELVELHWGQMQVRWKEWDANGDGSLARQEFQAAAVNRLTPGLELSVFEDWDCDGDNAVSARDAQQLLEFAFGVRHPHGELLQTASGEVVDWRVFRSMDRDQNEFVTREEFSDSSYGRALADAAARFRQFDIDSNESIRFHEWAADAANRSPTLERFLGLDATPDGRIDSTELAAAKLPAGQVLMVPHLLPSFDEDRNGFLSLREYQLTPLANLFANWPAAEDQDHDGRLSQGEFQFGAGPALAALSAEFFRRLDLNADGRLELTEWPFQIDPGRAPRSVVLAAKDTNKDGSLSLEEVLGVRQLPQPGQTVDMRLETRMSRTKTAFVAADSDKNEQLSLAELNTEAGREALAPGASSLSNTLRDAARARGISPPDETNWARNLVIGFNVLLLVSVALYFILKKEQA